MPSEREYTLEEFIREQVSGPEIWDEWQTVRDAPPPRATTRPAPPSSDLPFLREEEPASAEYMRMGELRAELIQGARDRLTRGGEWEILGRTGSANTRQPLERVDIETGVLNIEDNKIGPYRHISIRRARAPSNTAVLTGFIEAVCFAAGQPGIALTKDVIRELARHLAKPNFSTTAFAAAWDEAVIPEGWRKAGPRGRKPIVD